MGLYRLLSIFRGFKSQAAYYLICQDGFVWLILRCAADTIHGYQPKLLCRWPSLSSLQRPAAVEQEYAHDTSVSTEQKWECVTCHITRAMSDIFKVEVLTSLLPFLNQENLSHLHHWTLVTPDMYFQSSISMHSPAII